MGDIDKSADLEAGRLLVGKKSSLVAWAKAVLRAKDMTERTLICIDTLLSCLNIQGTNSSAWNVLTHFYREHFQVDLNKTPCPYHDSATADLKVDNPTHINQFLPLALFACIRGFEDNSKWIEIIQTLPVPIQHDLMSIIEGMMKWVASAAADPTSGCSNPSAKGGEVAQSDKPSPIPPAQLHERIRELERTNEQLVKSELKANQHIKGLNDALAESEVHRLALTTQNENLTKTNEQQKESISRLQVFERERAELLDRLDEFHAISQRLEKAELLVDKYKRRVAEHMQSNQREKPTSVSDGATKIAETTKRLAQEEQRAIRLTAQIEFLKSKLAVEEAAKVDWHRKQDRLSSAFEQLQAQNAQLVKEKSIDANLIESLQAKLQSDLDRSLPVSADMLSEQLQGELKELQYQLDLLVDEKAALISERDEIQRQLSSLKSKMSKLEFNLEVAEGQLKMSKHAEVKYVQVKEALHQASLENRSLHIALKQVKDHILRQEELLSQERGANPVKGSGGEGRVEEGLYAEAIEALRLELAGKEETIQALSSELARVREEQGRTLQAWNDMQLRMQQKLTATDLARKPGMLSSSGRVPLSTRSDIKSAPQLISRSKSEHFSSFNGKKVAPIAHSIGLGVDVRHHRTLRL